MRNISTDALHPWDRSMWTDAPTPLHEQFGMTAIEARLDRWYFDGDGDNGEGEGDTPEGEQTQAEEAAQQAAAQEAAEAAGFGGMGPDDLSTDAPGLTAEEAEEAFDAVGDLSDYSTTDAAQAATDIASASVSGSTADLSGFDTSAVEEAIDQLNEVGEVSIGYNDLAGFVDDRGFGLDFGPRDSIVSAIDEDFGPKRAAPDRVGTDYFDRKEDDIQRADQAIAAAIENNAKAQGRDVEVSVDPQGQFSYTPGPTGSLADVAAVAGSQMAQGFADLAPMASPTALAASMVNPDLFDLGLDLAPKTGQFSATTATQGVLSDRQGTFDRGKKGAGPAAMSLDEAVAQGIASVGPTDIQAPSPEVTITELQEAQFNPELQGVIDTALTMDLARDDIERQNREAMERQDRAAQQLSVDQGVVSPSDVITDPVEEQMVADAARAAAEGAVGPGSDIQFAQFDDSLLAEDIDLLGDILGDEDQGGDTPPPVVAQPKPDPEPPVEERTPRPFEILPFAASTPFTPRTQYGQIVPVTRTQFARPGGIADLQTQLAILNRRLFT